MWINKRNDCQVDFQKIYDIFQPKILRYLTRLIGEHEAEDITQEVFIKVNQALETFRGESQLSTWIYRIATNTALDRLRSPSFKQIAQERLLKNVKKDPRTRDIFAYFKEPWFFLESSDEYQNLFERSGFNVVFSEIENIKTDATPEEVFNNFSSGAIAAYLNQDFYNVEINGNYIDSFREITRETFFRQANDQRKVELIFNRLFLVAVKQ